MRVTYGTSTDDIHLHGEQVHNFAFSFISPLGSEDAVGFTPWAVVHFVGSTIHGDSFAINQGVVVVAVSMMAIAAIAELANSIRGLVQHWTVAFLHFF